MFLHLGGNTIVRTRDVVAILNIENQRTSLALQATLKAETDASAAGEAGEQAKSAVVTGKILYLSPISSGTLKKRADYLAELNK